MKSPQAELEAANLTVATTTEDFPVQRRESVPFLTQRLADPLCGDDDEPFLDKVHQCSFLMLLVSERPVVASTKQIESQSEFSLEKDIAANCSFNSN